MSCQGKLGSGNGKLTIVTLLSAEFQREKSSICFKEKEAVIRMRDILLLRQNFFLEGILQT